jgi:hypothetical protein
MRLASMYSISFQRETMILMVTTSQRSGASVCFVFSSLAPKTSASDFQAALSTILTPFLPTEVQNQKTVYFELRRFVMNVTWIWDLRWHGFRRCCRAIQKVFCQRMTFFLKIFNCYRSVMIFRIATLILISRIVNNSWPTPHFGAATATIGLEIIGALACDLRRQQHHGMPISSTAGNVFAQ